MKVKNPEMGSEEQKEPQAPRADPGSSFSSVAKECDGARVTLL